MLKKRLFSIAAALGLAGMAIAPSAAQIDTVDPDAALQTGDFSESDYRSGGSTTDQGAPADDPGYDTEPGFDADAAVETDTTVYADPNYIPDTPGYENEAIPAQEDVAGNDAATGEPTVPATQDGRTTYQQDDLIAAAGGVFGDGAEGLARIIEDILSDQGEPNGY
ncbi:MAG: EipA family protein, partial [Parasphingopyxis sp.]|uniref:EipA family protein n=1 Tax=Parasphingopyxis sp. TaxID=1920299 RepID=UPI003F9F8058